MRRFDPAGGQTVRPFVSKSGKAVPGPVFIMTKTANGEAREAGAEAR